MDQTTPSPKSSMAPNSESCAARPARPLLGKAIAKPSTKVSLSLPSSSPGRAFTATRSSHALSSDDESDTETVLRASAQRKRRRTASIIRLPSPRLDTSDEEAFAPISSFNLLTRRAHRRRRSVVPEQDRAARQRCFDYLLSGIDAVWAEYCDSTSHAESQLYMPFSPVSDADLTAGASAGTSGSVGTSQFAGESDCEEAVTPGEPASEQPWCQRLGELKRRLLNSKYFMSDLVTGDEPDTSARFWKRWDVIKYSVVELVEGEDEEHEPVIDELEDGRHF